MRRGAAAADRHVGRELLTMSCGTCTENWLVDSGDPLTETVVPAEASTCTSVGVFGLHRFT
jgi:hypothetical protein